MGLFDKIFGGGKKQAATTAVETPTLECPHAVLVPRWDSVQDMGIESKATRWMCEACKTMFSPAEADALKATLAERVIMDVPPVEEETPPPSA